VKDPNKRERICTHCGGHFLGCANRSFCSDHCRAVYAGRRTKLACRDLRPHEVEAQLSAAVHFETLPPWVRHPEPWTDVGASA